MDSPAPPPAINLIARGVRPRGLGVAANVARRAGTDGIELDVGRWISLLTHRPHDPFDDHPLVHIAAVWLPRPATGPVRAWQQERLIGEALSWARDRRPRRLVVDSPVLMGRSRLDGQTTAASRSFACVWQRLSSHTRLTITLRPHQLQGGRDHLDEVLVLRRFAEEWDFDIALDLSGPCDARWEAEAAIWRLMPRLQLIRLGRLDGVSRQGTEPRLASRVLACAADLDYRGSVSITPAIAGPLGWREDRLVEATALVADLIRSRFDVRGPLGADARDPQRFSWR